MKKDLHPTYYPNAKIICACGNVIVTGSTQEELHTELCSACHPFFTGKQKLLDSAGRGDRFRAQLAKAEKLKTAAVERKTNKKAAVKVIEDVTSKKAKK